MAELFPRRTLITGASGALGSILRHRFRGQPHLIFTDIVSDDGQVPDIDYRQADLRIGAQLEPLLEGVKVVVHLGAISFEAPWPVLRANIDMSQALYESARRAGVRRIVLGSSFHVSGYYEREERVDTSSPMRPDSLYAVTKGFAELMGRYYWDKFGIETVCLRLGSCNPTPDHRNMLATWLSHDDFTSLVIRCVSIPRTGFMVLYATSANPERFFDNDAVGHLGWAPRDSAEQFRDKLEAGIPENFDHPELRYKGGVFAARGSFDDDA